MTVGTAGVEIGDQQGEPESKSVADEDAENARHQDLREAFFSGKIFSVKVVFGPIRPICFLSRGGSGFFTWKLKAIPGSMIFMAHSPTICFTWTHFFSACF